MVFSSTLFLALFLPLFLAVYVLIPVRLRNFWLLLASVLFYAWGAPHFILIVLASIGFDYIVVSRMSESSGKRKLSLAALGIVANILLLAWFKYANFMVDNLSGLLELMGFKAGSWVRIALPIGISFFTFQKITYIVDVYRQVTPVQRSLFSYAMYVLMFPQLIAGPIVRYHEIERQIDGRQESIPLRLSGFFRFSIGLARKVIIADTLAGLADPVFSADPACLSATEAWLGLLAYAFQIYHDFAGYSDMAIGLGRMMGFDLPENFRNPYRSRSITEFWHRWHISLSRFMKDYLYIPLGGNRKGRGRTWFNLVFVFLLSGLWHGAAWTFVIWGAWHGLFLVLERLFLKRWLDKMPGLISGGFIFLVALLGWVVFRTDDLQHTGGFFAALAGQGEACQMILPGRGALFMLVLAAMISLAAVSGKVELWQERLMSAPSLEKPWPALVAAIVLYLLSLAFIMGASVHPFIYFQF